MEGFVKYRRNNSGSRDTIIGSGWLNIGANTCSKLDLLYYDYYELLYKEGIIGIKFLDKETADSFKIRKTESRIRVYAKPFMKRFDISVNGRGDILELLNTNKKDECLEVTFKIEEENK
jgi:hypothetical protein